MCDLIFVNANVITMDPAQPQAGLIAVRDGRIERVAKSEYLSQRPSRHTKIIDCQGRTILPGFIDAHCHVHAYAEKLMSVDLSPRAGVDSIDEIQQRIREYAGKVAPGTWIRGKGYSEFSLAEGRHPTRQDLDAAASAHPVKLTHRSGHAHVLNSLALKQTGIGANTGDPEGGLIDRDLETIEPTGILYGMGSYLAGRIPPLEDVEMRKGISLASEKLLSFGITSVQDASAYNNHGRWLQFEQWKAHGLFKPRLSMMLGLESFDSPQNSFRSEVVDENHLRSGGVKIIVHEVTGRLSPSREELNEHVLAIHRAGLQAIIHAIEGEAIDAACEAIAYALRTCPRTNHRHRIEHCSLCPSYLLDRISELDIAVVTQPPFIYYSGDRYVSTVPLETQEDLYPLGRMLRKGIMVGASSDFPIVDPDPLVGIYAAVTRLSEGGQIVAACEDVAIMDALKMYTVSAAAMNFEEDAKGSLRPGKAADFVILDADPRCVDAQSIKDIKVEMTVLGGEVVYRRTASMPDGAYAGERH